MATIVPTYRRGELTCRVPGSPARPGWKRSPAGCSSMTPSAQLRDPAHATQPLVARRRRVNRLSVSAGTQPASLRLRRGVRSWEATRVQPPRPRAPIVWSSSLTAPRNPAPGFGFCPCTVAALNRPGAQSSAQSGLGWIHPKTRKSAWNAGLRMARPGLEPGTPRFSVVEQNLSNNGGIPANVRVRAWRWRRSDSRKLRSFLVDLGTDTRFGAQSDRCIAVYAVASDRRTIRDALRRDAHHGKSRFERAELVGRPSR